MARIAFALVVFAGGLVAVHNSTDVPGVTPSAVTPRTKHRTPTVSRGAHRVPLAEPSPRPRRHRNPQPPPSSAPVPADSGTRLNVTAYCWTGSRNAAGNWPTVGTAAANAYPLGTRLHVEGYGVVVVEDRSAPGATDVDLFLGDDPGCEARAVAWGRRYLNVWKDAA